MLVQANALVIGNLVRPDAVEEESLEVAVESSAKENGEQKELWREKASSQLAFRSSFMNCHSALREVRGVA